MASTPFSLSSQLTGCQFSAAQSPDHPDGRRRHLRCSASHHAAGQNALKPASLYEVLGVRRGATRQEIKLAYRKLARALHPDAAAASDGGGGATSSAEDFMRVQAAYDGSNFKRRMAAAAPPLSDGYSECTGRVRTWETDQCW